MSNEITKKEFDVFKNDSSLSVVSFDKGGRRILTYGGLTYPKVIKEILEKQSRGFECLVIKNLPSTETSWERKDYDKYMRVQ